MPTRLFSETPIQINELQAGNYYLFVGRDMDNRKFEKFLKYESHRVSRILNNEIITIKFTEEPHRTRHPSISFNTPLEIYPLTININETYTFNLTRTPEFYMRGIRDIPWFVGHISYITENGLVHFESRKHRNTTFDIFAYNVRDILPAYLPNEEHTIPMFIALNDTPEASYAMVDAMSPDMLNGGNKKRYKRSNKRRNKKSFTIKNKKFIL